MTGRVACQQSPHGQRLLPTFWSGATPSRGAWAVRCDVHQSPAVGPTQRTAAGVCPAKALQWGLGSGLQWAVAQCVCRTKAVRWGPGYAA